MIEQIKSKLNWLTRIGIIILAVLAISSLVRGVIAVKRSDERIQQEKEKVAEEEKRNEELKGQLEEVNSQTFAEQVARDKLGLAKPGETVIVLPDKEVLRKLAPRIEEEQETLPDPNWRKWLKLFM